MGKPVQSSPESYPDTTIRRVNWPEDIEIIRRLFQEYSQWLSDHRDVAASADSTVSAGLAALDKQIAELPGAYGPPRGEILLAFEKEKLVACGALCELEPKVGEIKRLYVRADHRGPVFGRRLTSTLLSRARELGYERMRVYTLPTMTAAIQFYQELGFDSIPAYWPHPVRGALFFEYEVGKPSSSPLQPRAPKSKRAGK
jgi:ribosomal protein S18 acetylase RimI-like enzyme